MNLQYISDNKGITTGVFIPIQEWEELQKKYNLQDESDFTPEQGQEVQERIEQYRQDPEQLSTWEEVKKRLLNKSK